MAVFADRVTPEALRQRFGPALEAFDHNLEHAREVVADGRHAAQAAAEEAVAHVRTHPLEAVAVAAVGGMLVGCAVGFVAGRRVNRS